ncbi:UDP-N-acetylmuramate dehydrogenase [Salegentibacter chungangensis]|uniref:UDP-N-acetylenolpyruvoylglucosamine reductase n=1 Tax=Salegentibacter chungangensis TaxID=1335724 RepID=A0ABW3NUS2_9FLAO
MQVSYNTSLKNYNSFGIDVKAQKFIEATSIEDLEGVLRKTYSSELFILGGGSNMLLTQDLQKTVLHVAIEGKEIVSETEDEVIIKAMAGENWHKFVLWTLEQGYGGLENLSLIPGNVGTAPIQNIGAYGVELKDVFVSCEAMNVQTLQRSIFSLEDCDFGYRNSVFKKSLKGEVIITGVSFRLTKKDHNLHTGYGAIQTALAEKNIKNPGIKDISDAVISIRQQKLPDPAEIGNSGSFFKNPIVTKTKFEAIQKEFPEIPSYQINTTEVKIPAGWLIEQTGLKGYRKGDAGVHKNQALVLVNYGMATGKEILRLAHKVQKEVLKKFGISLEAEVNIY